MLYGRKAMGTVGYLGGLMALPEQFAWDLANLVQYNSEYLSNLSSFIGLERAKVSFHAAARNDLVGKMQGDWLLQLDTDMDFEPDVCARLVRLMNIHDVDIITGVYVNKAWPHPPVIYRWTEDEKLQQLGMWDQNVHLMQIGSAGGGMLLVKRKVFDKIKTEMQCGPFDIIPPFGEDHSFFLRCHRLGIKAYCAPLVEVKHLDTRGYSVEDFDLASCAIGNKIEVGGFR